jgi:hypothetical protein
MGSQSNYAETAMVNHFCGTSYTSVATIYLALCTADPTDAGTGASMNEVTNANNYARVAITFAAASGRTITQTGAVNFAQISGAAGTATHWAIVDSATHGAGNMLAHGALVESKELVNGSTPSVASGQVVVEMSTGGILTAYATLWLDKMYRNQTFAQPATYVALNTTTTSDSAAGTEVSGGSYARVLVNKAGGSTPRWNTVASGATDNENAITFPTASANWGNVKGFVIYDASSTGNAMIYGNDVVDQDVDDDDTAAFAAGALDISAT